MEGNSRATLRRLGLVNFVAIMQLIILRTYFVVFLETDLLTDILIITILGSLQNLLQIVFRVPLSRMSQLFGRKPLILVGIGSFTLAIFLMAIATHWIFVAGSTILIAFGMSAYWPATFASIGDIAGENYGEYNGKLFQYGDIGAIFASLVAKYLLDIQTYIQRIGLRELYWLFTGISILFVLISLRVLPESHHYTGERKSVLKEWKSSLGTMIADTIRMTRTRYLGRIYLLQFIVSFSEFGFVLFFPKLVVDYGYTKGNVAEILLYGTLVLFIVKPQLGKVSDRFGYLRPIGISLVIMSASIFLQLTSSNFLLLAVTYTSIFGVLMVSYPAINGGTSKSANPDLRGQAMGVLGVYTSLGRGLSTIYLGTITGIFNLEVAFLLFAGFILILGVLVLLEYKRVGKKVPFS